MIKRSLFLLFFLTSSLTQAQDMFQEYLYSADLVMKNRDRISLTDAQAEKIKKIHSTNAADFSTLKWDLDAATEKLKKLLEQPKPDAAAVSRQMDEVLQLENQLKKKQLATLVAIKSELTEAQQSDLKKTKVMGRVTSWEYAPNGAATSLPRSSPQYRVGKETSVKGIASVKESGSGVVTSKVGPQGDVTIYPDGAKIYFQTGKDKDTNKPLYLLKTEKGMEEFSNFDHINPDTIQSIEVLKDETAVVRFGEKGKNGVIIITLKEKKEELPLEN